MKLMLAIVTVLIVAEICMAVVFCDYLKTFTFQWSRSPAVTVSSEETGLFHSSYLDTKKKKVRAEPRQHDVVELIDSQLLQKRANQHSSESNGHSSQEGMVPSPPPNLPYLNTSLSVTSKTLMNLPWVKDLWTFVNLKVDSTKPVVITCSNHEFHSTLINWLVHTLVRLGNHSVQNVLILSMDRETHTLLQSKNISSLFLSQEDLILTIPSNNKYPGLFQVMLSRLIAMRLINSWGFDVINYDSDAFILKNPQELFDLYPHSHVIGSEAFSPKRLHAKWGVTLCMGVILLRASPETGISMFIAIIECIFDLVRT